MIGNQESNVGLLCNVFGKGHFSVTWNNIQDLADVSYRVQSTIQHTAFSEEAEYMKEKVL
jgi:hypothetical protein